MTNADIEAKKNTEWACGILKELHTSWRSASNPNMVAVSKNEKAIDKLIEKNYK